MRTVVSFLVVQFNLGGHISRTLRRSLFMNPPTRADTFGQRFACFSTLPDLRWAPTDRHGSNSVTLMMPPSEHV